MTNYQKAGKLAQVSEIACEERRTHLTAIDDTQVINTI